MEFQNYINDFLDLINFLIQFLLMIILIQFYLIFHYKNHVLILMNYLIYFLYLLLIVLFFLSLIQYNMIFYEKLILLENLNFDNILH